MNYLCCVIKNNKMKTNALIIKTTVIALMVILSAVSVGARDFNTLVKVYSLSEKKALVRLINPEFSTLKISISNENGEVNTYNEKVKDVNYVKVFNLSLLEDGKYKMVIETPNDKVVKYIEVKNNTLKIE